MLKERINEMIATEMKNGNHTKTEVFRSIKNEFLKFETAKNAKPLDNNAEITIIQRMVKQHEESIESYKKANRSDLIDCEQKELNILKEFLPEEPKESDIRKFLMQKYPSGIEKKKEMGLAIKSVKTMFAGAPGKLVSDIVKSIIK